MYVCRYIYISVLSLIYTNSIYSQPVPTPMPYDGTTCPSLTLENAFVEWVNFVRKHYTNGPAGAFEFDVHHYARLHVQDLALFWDTETSIDCPTYYSWSKNFPADNNASWNVPIVPCCGDGVEHNCTKNKLEEMMKPQMDVPEQAWAYAVPMRHYKNITTPDDVWELMLAHSTEMEVLYGNGSYAGMFLRKIGAGIMGEWLVGVGSDHWDWINCIPPVPPPSVPPGANVYNTICVTVCSPYEADTTSGRRVLTDENIHQYTDKDTHVDKHKDTYTHKEIEENIERHNRALAESALEVIKNSHMKNELGRFYPKERPRDRLQYIKDANTPFERVVAY